MLELKNICVSFRSENQEKWFRTTRTQVLSDISFQLKKEIAWGFWANLAVESPP